MNVSIGLNPFHKILWNVTKILKCGTALITLCSYNQRAWGKYLKYLTASEGYFSTGEANLVPPSGRSSPSQNSGASWGCGVLAQMSIWDSSYSKRDPTRCVLRISQQTMIIEKQTNIHWVWIGKMETLLSPQPWSYAVATVKSGVQALANWVSEIPWEVQSKRSLPLLMLGTKKPSDDFWWVWPLAQSPFKLRSFFIGLFIVVTTFLA